VTVTARALARVIVPVVKNNHLIVCIVTKVGNVVAMTQAAIVAHLVMGAVKAVASTLSGNARVTK